MPFLSPGLQARRLVGGGALISNIKRRSYCFGHAIHINDLKN